ncbi:hypothetical protein HDU67_007280 [Dinochytrium kinnereticum]|nr:hypothetical protein HDU67_007280 [Dinochytrium kinnereticum]
MTTAATPIYSAIQQKLTQALAPTAFELEDNSWQHAHHEAMKGTSAKETHFIVKVVSPAFQGKSLVQRHQMIYKLLDDELKNKGLHALQITAKTPEEIAKN